MLEDIFGKYENFEYRERKPTNKLVEGMGINDSPFVVKPTIDKKRITFPAYEVWHAMLKRCYNLDYKYKHQTYKEVICCSSWLLFTNFAIWFKNNYVKDWQLDKDILIKENKIYSPETCILVPREINNFLTLRGNMRGEFPIGVTIIYGGKFQAQIRLEGRLEYLGSFDTEKEAHKAWQRAKLEQAIAFDFPPLQRVIDQLKFEIENNLETTSL